MPLCFVRSLVLIAIFASVGLVPVRSGANHADDQCPDIHVSGESATQTFYDDLSAQQIPPWGEVPLQTKLTVHGVTTIGGYCDTYVWNPSTQTCDFGQRYDRTTSRIRGWLTDPLGTQWLAGDDWAVSPPNTQFFDSTDDVATTQGAVTDSIRLTKLGEYEHFTASNIGGTPCDVQPDFVQSAPQTLTVIDPDIIKDSDCDKNGVGNPCGPGTGNKHQVEVDHTGPILPITRYYNSHGAVDVGLGYGWRTRYHGRHLTVLQDKIIVRRGTGRGEIFTKQGPTTWVGDADTELTLIPVFGLWAVVRRDEWVEAYTSTGRLFTEYYWDGGVDGPRRNYTYDAEGRLEKVERADTGHTLLFSYDAEGHVDAVTLPDGETVQYDYQDGNLTGVTHPDLTTKTYHYEETSYPHHLTGITDERGIRFATYGYDANGLAILTEHAETTNGGPQESFDLSFDSATQTTVTDPRGNVDVYTFSARVLGVKRLLERSHIADGLSVTQTFDGANNLLTRTDELGRATGFTYDGNLVETRTEAVGEPEERTTTYSYHVGNVQTDKPETITSDSVLAGQQRQTEIDYDDPIYVFPTSITQSGYDLASNPVSRTVALGYDSAGRLTSYNGPRTDLTDVTAFAYYTCTTGSECGQLASTTNALGHVTTFDSYDGAGRLTQLTDPLDVVTTYSYDDRGRVLSISAQPPAGPARVWSFTYTPDGQLETSQTPGGVLLSYEYDAARYLSAVEDGDGNRVEYAYDLTGNRTGEELRDDSGTLLHSIARTHDTRNRLEQLQEGTSVTDIVFDAVGRLTSIEDPNDHETQFTYDVLDRLDTRINALTKTTDLDYHPDDSLAQIEAPNLVTTSYESDDLGNRTKEVSPDRGTLAYGHDDAGNVTGFTHQGSGRTVAYTYDALNRPLTRDYPGTAQDVTFTYDTWGSTCTNGTGRLCHIQGEHGTTEFAYDAFGNVTRRTETIGGITYVTDTVYDADNRITQITYPTGHIVGYTHDSEGRTQSVTLDSGSGPVTVTSGRTYRGDGLLTAQTWGNGLAETRTYNGLRLLETFTLGLVESETFLYDPAGRLTSRSGSAWAKSYGYDDIDRLTSDTGGSGNRAYTYDDDGDRLTLDVGGSVTPYSYDTGTNRLSDIDGDPVTVDAEGRTTDTIDRNYVYNAAGRLEIAHTKHKQGQQTILTEVGRYAYDAFGLRRTKLADGVTTVYHYDEAGNLLAETDDTGALVKLYVWAVVTPIAQVHLETQGQGQNQTTVEVLVHLHVDHLNTPRWATDEAGDIVWRWQSDGFGVALPDEDVDGDNDDVVVNLRFPGQYYDAETDLNYNRFRYYDPAVGRYLTTDPIGLVGGTNVYSYASLDPGMNADPTGLVPIIPGQLIPLLGSEPSDSCPVGSQEGGGNVNCPGGCHFGNPIEPNRVSSPGVDEFAEAVGPFLPLVPFALTVAPVLLATPTAAELLVSGGALLGAAGSRDSIRVVHGGLQQAQTLFNALSRGGQLIERTASRTLVRLNNGGFVQLRTTATRSPKTAATIDVNIPGIGIDKIKFNP